MALKTQETELFAISPSPETGQLAKQIITGEIKENVNVATEEDLSTEYYY